jgi:hypothetical protein
LQMFSLILQAASSLLSPLLCSFSVWCDSIHQFLLALAGPLGLGVIFKKIFVQSKILKHLLVVS